MSDAWLDDDDDDVTYTPLQIKMLEMGLPIEDDLSDDEPDLTPEQVRALQAKRIADIFQPKPYVLKTSKKRLAIVDTETDPFAWGEKIEPFTLGFFDGERYVDFVGDDCVKQFFEYLATLDDDFIIYAHNGGKFDFHFFLDYLDEGQPLIMGGRMVKLDMQGQEFRDSYSIIPMKLEGYKKTKIDYSKFTKENRHKHMTEIRDYQRDDCLYLFDLVRGFHEMFGDKLTIASAALPMVHSMHGFQRMRGDKQDEKFRQYYFGGRNQCFETGVLRPKFGKNFYLYDKNSMYPAAMRDYLHPISANATLQTRIDENTDFACIVAKNDGALPQRAEDGGLDFTVKYGTFYATIHEIRAGLDTGCLRIDRVKHAWAFDRKSSFAQFVEHFYDLRLLSKAAADIIREILYKFVLNSAYGKFALNPRKFKQWRFTMGEIPQPQRTADCPGGWSLSSQSGDVFIWSRPNPRKFGFYNVATAASITGAARSDLLRNIAKAKRPIYCDTDSIMCEGFDGDLGNALGQWKLEATGDMAAIAGKKMYALIDSTSPAWLLEGEALKKASKGVSLSPREIIRVCNGEEVIYQNPVPQFQLGKDYRQVDMSDFQSRRINKTGVI